jgi:predicted amidohydrolase
LNWEKVDLNLKHIDKLLQGLSPSTHLTVLPEMFSTGFSMRVELAETMEGKTVSWLKEAAARYNTCIAGSAIISDKGEVYNRLLFAYPDGRIDWYDKRHLFRMANEHDYFAAGNSKLIVNCHGWKINLQVCYDLRFPVWSRNTYHFDENKKLVAAYDAMIYVANWPAVRISAWDVLLQARAIENQSYVIGVNRVGTDGNGIEYNGHSVVIDPKGMVALQAKEGEETLKRVTLSYKELSDFRRKFPVGLDADTLT